MGCQAEAVEHLCYERVRLLEAALMKSLVARRAPIALAARGLLTEAGDDSELLDRMCFDPLPPSAQRNALAVAKPQIGRNRQLL